MSFHICYYHITNSALSVLVLVHITSRSGVQIVIKQTDSYDSVFLFQITFLVCSLPVTSYLIN